jgi:hypothetical protein
MKYFALITLFISLFLFTACLDTDFDEPNTEFVLFAALDENENFFELGEDQVRVLSVRLKVDNIRLNAAGSDDEVFASSPTYLNLNNFAIQDEIFIGAGEIFGGSYTGVSLDLIRPPLDSQINDDEMIVRDDAGNIVRRNSYVIQGIYNGFAFVVSSESTPTVNFSFDRNINMPDKLGTLRVSLLAEWKEWFVNENRDGLLDPNDPSDSEKIRENFLRFFTPITFTLGEL